MAFVYLNGELLPLEQARVSVLDRGFLFGDGVYEVIPAYGGRLFRLTQHLKRLDQSLAAIRMENPLSHQEWARIMEQLLEQDPSDSQAVYLHVTRGPAPERDHLIPERITPTLFVMARPIKPRDPEIPRRGVAAATVDDVRWQLCNVKAVTLLANVLLRQEAADQQALEAILIRDGMAVEGAVSNLFVVLEGTLVTPPKSRYLLPGITRDLVLELAQEAGLLWREEEIPTHRLKEASEVWVTSSTREVLPVTRLDGAPVGEGIPGPLWCRMDALYQDYKQRLRRGEVMDA